MKYDIQASHLVLSKFSWEELQILCLNNQKTVIEEDFAVIDYSGPKPKTNKKNDMVKVIFIKVKDTTLAAALLKDKRGYYYSFYLAEEWDIEVIERRAEIDNGLSTGHFRLRE